MKGWVRSALLGVIAGYQRFISPVTPASCRFNPTCSEYARQSIDRYGALKGSGLALRRLLRCHPFGGHGYDPVPPSDPQNEGRSIPAGKEAV